MSSTSTSNVTTLYILSVVDITCFFILGIMGVCVVHDLEKRLNSEGSGMAHDIEKVTQGHQ